MSKLLRALIILLVLVVLGGVGFLVTWDIPAPTARQEVVLPDERFPR